MDQNNIIFTFDDPIEQLRNDYTCVINQHRKDKNINMNNFINEISGGNKEIKEILKTIQTIEELKELKQRQEEEGLTDTDE
jgi:hypothetical protein